MERGNKVIEIKNIRKDFGKMYCTQNLGHKIGGAVFL